ncbi:MAG: Nif3-like dinuclear metal center hexameric protein [Rhodothermales bacterium]
MVLVFCWPSLVAAQSITAREVISRIQEQVGIPWSDRTVDTFKAGDPDAPVTGVAVTMMATLDVLQRAAAEGHNLIITHEPTFYGHLDETAQLEADDDPIYLAKKRYIEEHGLIVWRFHDYWHQRVPDGVTEGMIRQLGWTEYPRVAGANVFTAPETTVRELAKDIEKRFDIKTLRVVGDPDMRVTRLAFAAGFPGFAPQQRLFRRDDVEVLVMGEAHEWETILYGADAVAAGMRKALIVMGHIPSEQAGMENCAEWMQGFVTEVPVAFVPAKEPFWRP